MKFHTALNRAAIAALLLAAGPTFAQSFRVQCPNGTSLHPANTGGKKSVVDSMIPTDSTRPTPAMANPQIKCQEISGGDGFATMADGQQIYLFAFGPLSGLKNIQAGIEGTVMASEFNAAYTNGPLLPTDLATPSKTNAGAAEPSLIMNLGVLSGETPAPSIAVDEDDELYLTLSNVGMIMRPDLFEQHTVHWHGYPNASSYFDGVPDASVAINIAGSFTYYYTAPDAGSYFWHCHITPPEHLQMGMEGNLWVRPRQNKVTANSNLYLAMSSYLAPADAGAAAGGAPGGPANANKNGFYGAHVVSFPPDNCMTGTNPFTGLPSTPDVLCSDPLPAANNGATHGTDSSGNLAKYAYNDGDGTTRYDVEYPIQLMGFDPNFHFIGMTFNPEPFVDMKDKYYLMSGRGYPDTVNDGPITTEDSDGATRISQPVRSHIVINRKGGQTKALLRFSNLSVTEFHYVAAAGVPMQVIAHAGRLLRDLSGNNLYYNTNTLEIGPGDNADVLLDVTNVQPGTYFLYSPSLDRLSNDAENFGGQMTEIQVL
jgi:FtsP/CotA-like multicopper oxidase with cupredoxin domain